MSTRIMIYNSQNQPMEIHPDYELIRSVLEEQGAGYSSEGYLNRFCIQDIQPVLKAIETTIMSVQEELDNMSEEETEMEKMCMPENSSICNSIFDFTSMVIPNWKFRKSRGLNIDSKSRSLPVYGALIYLMKYGAAFEIYRLISHLSDDIENTGNDIFRIKEGKQITIKIS